MAEFLDSKMITNNTLININRKEKYKMTFEEWMKFEVPINDMIFNCSGSGNVDMLCMMSLASSLDHSLITKFPFRWGEQETPLRFANFAWLRIRKSQVWNHNCATSPQVIFHVKTQPEAFCGSSHFGKIPVRIMNT